MNRLLFILVLCLVCPSARATVYNAASPSAADVQAAINLASPSSTFAAPNTVLIPVGTANFANVWITNSLILAGSGLYGTVLTDTNTTSVNTIDWTKAVNQFCIISNIYFNVTASRGSGRVIYIGSTLLGNDAPTPHPATTTGGKTNLIRITQVTLNGSWVYGIEPLGWDTGVIDHCYFNPSQGATGVYMFGEGDYSWDTRPLVWGDTNRLFVENCGFNWPLTANNANGAIDDYNGMRYCFRHNSVTNINVGGHGTDSSSSNRSPHSGEVYDNFFYNSSANQGIQFLGGWRGGTLLVYSNTLAGYSGGGTSASITIYRASGTNIYIEPSWSSSTSYGLGNFVQSGGTSYVSIAAGNLNNVPPNALWWSAYPYIPCCNPWGPVYAVGNNWWGAVDGTNAFDGNTLVSGYPSIDQIGYTGPTDWTHFSDATAPNGLSTGYTVQVSSPCYSWANTNTTAHVDVGFTVGNSYANTGAYAAIPSAATLIQSGRDYFNDTPAPGYTPLPYPHPLDSSVPVFSIQPQSQSVTAGDSVTFTALASYSPTYQWYFGASAISGATLTSYNIPSASSGDVGTYTVIASNLYGQTTSAAASLSVASGSQPPMFTLQPQSVTLNVGQPASFTVTATGTMPITYQWYYNSGSIAGATLTSLSIPVVAVANAGLYNAVAVNSDGTTASSSADLSVIFNIGLTGSPAGVGFFGSQSNVTTNTQLRGGIAQ